RDGGAADRHPGVAPGRDVPRGIAHPHPTHAEPRDEGDGPVDDQRLAVIAREPAEGARELRRVIDTHLDACVAEPSPEPARGLPEVAEPVVDDAHVDARARAGGEGVSELPPDLVVPDEVVLEM